MRILVSDIDNVQDHGSVWTFTGEEVTDDDEPTGQLYTFAVDHRMAQGLIEAIADDGPTVCAVESWQVLGWPVDASERAVAGDLDARAREDWR